MTSPAQTSAYEPRDIRRFDRWVAAILMPIGPAAVAVLRFAIPPQPVGESVAANPGAQRLVLAMGAVAVFTLLPGAFAAIRLVRPHMPVFSAWIAAFLIPGYLGMTALFATDAVAMAGTDLGLEPPLVTKVSAAVFALPSFGVMVMMFIVGHIVGMVLLGIAAYGSRLIPRAPAILLAISQPLHLTAVILATPWLDLLGWGLTAMGMAFFSVRLTRMDDADWDLPPLARVPLEAAHNSRSGRTTRSTAPSGAP